MVSYNLFIFVFSANQVFSIEGFFQNSVEDINIKVNNKKQLINIIDSLNENENLVTDDEGEHEKMHRNENTKDLSDAEKEEKLQEVIWLIKTNYDAQKQFNSVQNPTHSGARIYFIRNPEVIDEYKKYLEKKKIEAARDKSIKNELQELRRNVMFRMNEESNDISDNNKNFDKSGLNTQERLLLDREDYQNRHMDTVEDRIQENNYNYKESSEEPITKKKLPVDSMELHKKKVHRKLKSDKDFRRETSEYDIKKNRIERKQKRAKIVDNDQKIDNPNSDKKPATYKYYDDDKINANSKKSDENNWKKPKKIKRNSYDSDQFKKYTTKDYKRIVNDRPKFKPKPRLEHPKSKIKPRNYYSGHVRTSIPFVSKKGIYEEE